MKLSLIIEAIDRLTAPVRRIQQQIDRLTEPATRAGRALGRLSDVAGLGRMSTALGGVLGRARGVADALGTVGSRVALLGGAALGGGLALFKTQFLDVASQFEQFQTILEVTEGTADKAQTAFAWISDFATRTPYELDQVTDAFVRLRGAGLDATNGLLAAAGDAAAARGKSVADAVEAINDAVVGENERLKEFGINASKVGDQIVYEYAVNGQTMRRVADANNRATIAGTLQAIWNEQYGGAMQKLSRTWDGIMSNLSDVWTRWTAAVMDAGVFDWLKSRAQGLLDQVNAMAADGSLQRWAEDVAARIIRVFEATERLLFGFDVIGDRVTDIVHVPGLFERIGTAIDRVAAFMRPITDRFGTFETILAAVALVIAGPLLVAIAGLTQAFAILGVTMMATPVGWIMAGIAALAAGAYLIYRNWEPISDFFEGIWNRITGVVEAAGALRDRVYGGIASFFGLDDAGASAAGPVGAAGVPIAGQRVDTGGTLNIRIDSEGRPRVAEARPNDPRADWALDTGVVMGTP